MHLVELLLADSYRWVLSAKPQALCLRSDISKRVISGRMIVDALATARLRNTACLVLHIDAVWRSVRRHGDSALITRAPQLALEIIKILRPFVQPFSVGLACTQLRTKRHDHVTRLYNAIERVIRFTKPMVAELEHVC